jgi:hypothetical protein
MTRALPGLMLLVAAACRPESSVTPAGPLTSSPSPTTRAPATPIETSDARSSATTVGGCQFTVDIDGALPHVTHAQLHQWVYDSADIVATYLDGFPVPDMRIQITTSGARSIGFGQHFEGRRIRVRTGVRVRPEDLRDDWVMVHEMFHAAFPDLAGRHRWMQEGLSTYLESLTRTRAGLVPPERLWRRWVRSMPYGVPRSGDRGLDNTRTWGALYWGGALFWMIADVRIREATEGERGLDTALRAIVEAGGTGRADWTTDRVISICDEATGTRVVSELYASMALKHVDVDLDALWAELGVITESDGVRFDDAAPLAYVRRGMDGTSGDPASRAHQPNPSDPSDPVD